MSAIERDFSSFTDFPRRFSEELRPVINRVVDIAHRTREKIISILKVPNNIYQLNGIGYEKIVLMDYCTDTIDAANTFHKNISLFQVQECSPQSNLDVFEYGAALSLLNYSFKDILKREVAIISLDKGPKYDWKYFV